MRSGRNDSLPVAEDATEALPGSEEKIRVMAERLSQGRALFHPKDGLPRGGLFGKIPQVSLNDQLRGAGFVTLPLSVIRERMAAVYDEDFD